MIALFYLAGAVAVLATLLAISRLNAVHALLYLVVSLLAVSFVFFLLGAPFAAALEVIVYAGAIMVLFVFVVMLLNLGRKAEAEERYLLTPGIWRGPVVLVTVLLLELVMATQGLGDHAVAGPRVPPEEVGAQLFSTYVLGVEMASMLLLAGLVAAFHVGRRPPRDEGRAA